MLAIELFNQRYSRNTKLEMDPDSSLCTRNPTLLLKKRVGLEPEADGDDRPATEVARRHKKPRLKEGGAGTSTNVSLLPARLPTGADRPFGALPDAVLARLIAETQQKNSDLKRYLYPSSPGISSDALTSRFDPLIGMCPPTVRYYHHQTRVGMLGAAMRYPQYLPTPLTLTTTSMTHLKNHNRFLAAAPGVPLEQPNPVRQPPKLGSGLKPAALSRTSSIDLKKAASRSNQHAHQEEKEALSDYHHAHYSKRVCIGLAIDEDPNWLSKLQTFVRMHLLEVCWADREDVAVRNASKKVAMDQVGIRCRFCAHRPAGCRSQRSSAFPSSIPQLYQSFTMMLRDHFDSCSCIPPDVMSKYLVLKSSTCQGATEAKKYWSYSAAKLGMVDTEVGIIMNDETRTKATSIPAFGWVSGECAVPEAPGGGPILLVKETDQAAVSGFLYALISQFQKIELLPSERKGNRKSLKIGLPGFGCIYCTAKGRFGMSRVFPARRRTLPIRIADMYDHMCRCNLCPTEVKTRLQQLRESEQQGSNAERMFLDSVWDRLFHEQANPEAVCKTLL